MACKCQSQWYNIHLLCCDLIRKSVSHITNGEFNIGWQAKSTCHCIKPKHEYSSSEYYTSYCTKYDVYKARHMVNIISVRDLCNISHIPASLTSLYSKSATTVPEITVLVCFCCERCVFPVIHSFVCGWLRLRPCWI